MTCFKKMVKGNVVMIGSGRLLSGEEGGVVSAEGDTFRLRIIIVFGIVSKKNLQ